MNINDFSGAKLAILAKDHVLGFLRDDISSIPFPGMWDLPGGGRKGTETPVETALRETWEETGLRVSGADVVWERLYPVTPPDRLPTWFMVARPGWLTLPPLRLGDEGQAVKWLPVENFLALDTAIDHMQWRLQDYFADVSEDA